MTLGENITVPGHVCKHCTWLTIHCACKGSMSISPPFSAWKYWAYCSNKACPFHAGEGYVDIYPEFVLAIRQPPGKSQRA